MADCNLIGLLIDKTSGLLYNILRGIQMNYLFFDTECAYGKGGICEFGYILTDENFNTIKSDNLLINPHIKFDDYGHSKAGIVFAYTKNEYYSAPDIMDRYEEIKALLTDKNNIVIGYATESDAKFLINDLSRFDLPQINFEFWDVLRMYKLITGRESKLKLDVLYSESGEEPLMHHQALSDTKMTVAVLKKLLKDNNLTFEQIITDYKHASGESFNGRVVINDGSVFNYTKGGRTTAANRRILDNFIKSAPIGRLSDKFNDSIFSVAPNIAKDNFAVTMAVLYHSKKMGATFTLSICDAHYLLVDEKSKIPKQRLRRGVQLLNKEEMETLLSLAHGTLDEENIVLDQIIGELPANKVWYEQYKSSHNM